MSLLIQIALPCLLFAPKPTHLTLRGGTNAEMAPQIDYTVQVLKPMLELFGIQMDCHIATRFVNVYYGAVCSGKTAKLAILRRCSYINKSIATKVAFPCLILIFSFYKLFIVVNML